MLPKSGIFGAAYLQFVVGGQVDEAIGECVSLCPAVFGSIISCSYMGHMCMERSYNSFYYYYYRRQSGLLVHAAALILTAFSWP
jgi:hypothetical protein